MTPNEALVLDRIVVALEKIAADNEQPAHPAKMVVEYPPRPPSEPTEDFTKRLQALDKAVFRGGASAEDVVANARVFYAFLCGKEAPVVSLTEAPKAG